MGNVCDPQDSNDKNDTTKSRSHTKMNMIKIDDREIAVAKLCVHRDRFERKLDEQDKILSNLKNQAIQLNQTGKKDEAHFTVKKIKRVMEFKKKLLMKVDFVDKQIENIENFSDDAAFTKAIKESNTVIAKINSEINMEEIEVAKEL